MVCTAPLFFVLYFQTSKIHPNPWSNPMTHHSHCLPFTPSAPHRTAPHRTTATFPDPELDPEIDVESELETSNVGQRGEEGKEGERMGKGREGRREWEGRGEWEGGENRKEGARA